MGQDAEVARKKKSEDEYCYCMANSWAAFTITDTACPFVNYWTL